MPYVIDDPALRILISYELLLSFTLFYDNKTTPISQTRQVNSRTPAFDILVPKWREQNPDSSNTPL